jgi:hypothetical protein
MTSQEVVDFVLQRSDMSTTKIAEEVCLRLSAHVRTNIHRCATRVWRRTPTATAPDATT